MKLESEIGSIITLILILFSNYFAINYFANFLSQNFWNKILAKLCLIEHQFFSSSSILVMGSLKN